MKIYQYDVRKGNKIETAVVVPYASDSRVEEIAQNQLQGADEVILTVWENGSKVETLSFVNEVEVAPIQVEETPLVVEEVKFENIKIWKEELKLNMLKDASDVFSWSCVPRYGEVSCMLVNGKRAVKRKVKADKFGEYIEENKVKYYI